MIRVENMEKRFGPQVLFQDLSWHIRPGERIGLVGPNGAGKTTLVRILAGREEADSGKVQKARTIRVGYLPQEIMEFDQGTILESALEGQGEVASLEREMHALADRMAAQPQGSEADELTTRYGQVQDRFAALGGYDLETRARTILTGLGFDPENLDRPLDQLSGGWQMRVALARLLLADPDLLLLDEPTNHLDLESLDWLEEFLQARDGAFVLTGLPPAVFLPTALIPGRVRFVGSPVRIPTESEVLFVVDQGWRPISGRVVADATGHPVPGAVVTRYEWREPVRTLVFRTETDAKGRFETWASFDHSTVYVSKEGFPQTSAWLKEGEDELIVRLKQFGTQSGRAHAADVSISAHHDANIAVKRHHAADRLYPG